MAALLKYEKFDGLEEGNQVDEESKKEKNNRKQVKTMSRQQVFIWNSMAIRSYSTIIAAV